MIIFGSRGHFSAIGGVENSLRSLVRAASAFQRESIIICRYALKGESISGDGFALPNGASEINYRDDTCFSLWRRLINFFRGGVELPSVYKRLFNEHPNAVVIVRHHSHALAARFVGYRNVRYLVPSWTENQLAAEIEGADWTTKIRLLAHKKVDGYLQRKAVMKSTVFVFSRSMRRQIINAYPKKKFAQEHIRLVRPGVDAGRFYPGTRAEILQIRAKLGFPPGAVIWLFVGRFVHAKGLKYIIDALELSSDENILVMVGEGDRKGFLIQNIVQRKLHQRVRFFEKVSNVEEFYRGSDVFVMSSSYEPFGQTIIEASACGLPIAAFSEVSGANTATHELGLDDICYADTLTGASLHAAIGRALALSNDKANLSNGEKIHDLFSWETLLADLLA